MASDLNKQNDFVSWKELEEGCKIYGGGGSKEFNTGEWRVDCPVWLADKCKQCLICTPVCPDSSIPVVDGKRTDFDYDHCKGCGICAKACPFGAIVMKKEEK